jgi:hypothetical protein
MGTSISRRRLFLAIALASAAVAALTQVVPTLATVLLAALAILFYFWAKNPIAMEAAILRLPQGQRLLAALRWIDTVGAQTEADDALKSQRYAVSEVRTAGSKLLAFGRRATREQRDELNAAKVQWENNARRVLSGEDMDQTFQDRFDHGPVEQIGTFVGPNQRSLNDLNAKLLRLDAILKELRG